jgi:hypothetical protein
MSEHALSIYLSDHLAGATAGVALARRVAQSTATTDEGPVLAGVAEEIEADRDTLERVMSELGVRGSPLKNSAAWLVDRVASFKPSGRMRDGNAYHRLHELEKLSLGIAGKQALWEALRTAPDVEVAADLDALDQRARSQRERVETARLSVAAHTLGPE